MSCMFRKNDCVPAGTLVQLIAGDSPSPVATPGAAWLNFTGTSPPSGNPGDRQRHAPEPPARRRAVRAGCCAASGTAASTAIIETTNSVLRPHTVLLNVIDCRERDTCLRARW